MSIEAEKAILACIFINPQEALPIAIETLGRVESPFSEPAMQSLWEDILALDEAGKPIDVALLDMQRHAVTINDVIGRVPTSTYAKDYAEQVLKDAVHRHMAESIAMAAKQFKSRTATAGQIAEALGQRLGDLMTETESKSKVVDADAAATALLNRMRSMIERGASMSGIPTGIHKLDAIIHGLQPEDMIVLAARPSVGKTAFALQIMRHVALTAKAPCLMFSMEMSTDALMVRHAQATDAVMTERLRTGWQSKGEIGKIESAVERWRGTKCKIADVPAINAMQMRNITRRFRQQHGSQMGLIIIDYMQLMSGDKRQPREAQVAEISRNIKALAREIHWPVLTLSQLNRDGDDGEPRLSHLRESGAIEQDADVVMLMHRPKQQEGEHWVSLRVAKQRNGPLGVVPLWFDKDKQTFLEAVRDDRASANTYVQPYDVAEYTEEDDFAF